MCCSCNIFYPPSFSLETQLLLCVFVFVEFIWCTLVRFTVYCFCLISLVDEAAREKLAPFSALSKDESYQSRDLEKVNHCDPVTDKVDSIAWLLGTNFLLMNSYSNL